MGRSRGVGASNGFRRRNGGTRFETAAELWGGVGSSHDSKGEFQVKEPGRKKSGQKRKRGRRVRAKPNHASLEAKGAYGCEIGRSGRVPDLEYRERRSGGKIQLIAAD